MMSGHGGPDRKNSKEPDLWSGIARLRGSIFGLGTALLVSACATEAIVPLPPERPAKTAATVASDANENREHRRMLAAFGGEYRVAAIQNLVDETILRVGEASERPDIRYRVTILNSSSINAFALPNGSVYVTRGLLALANDTSELASVLAHEVAHVTARHAIERAELERRSVLVSRVNSDLLNDPQTGQARQDQGRVAIASFSRQQELDADQIGVRTVAKAGYDPFGASRFLASLGRSAVLRGRSSERNGPDFLSTHPSTPERIQTALLAARQLSAPGSLSPEKERSERTRYLAAISGMTFGDDPGDGIIKGNQFLHPRLGFAFNAPEGFKLENSAQAVLGTKGGGQQALRFESIKLAQGTSLEDYLRKSPVENIPTSNVEPFAITGFQAATALANSDSWTYRFAVIRMGDRAYRMILAAQSYTPEVDREFKSSLATFRSLSAEESGILRQQKINIVTAQAGDTAETLAARAAGEPALEKFLVLNGLQEGQALRSGNRYKIIGS